MLIIKLWEETNGHTGSLNSERKTMAVTHYGAEKVWIFYPCGSILVFS